jgi:hypothetical protein
MKNLILILGLIIGMCCFIAVTATAEQEYYTWIDENGITNYAERNPEGVLATFVSRNQSFSQRARNNTGQDGRPQSTAPNAAESSGNSSASNPRGPDPDALVNEQAALLAAERAGIQRQNCEIGKSNLAQLKAFSRLRVTDEKGENRILTEDEKQARADVARQTIRDNCTG